MNRYRNGWSASSAATKQFVDEQVRRRGKPKDGVPAIPLAELPVPVPLSRFQWPLVRPCQPLAGSVMLIRLLLAESLLCICTCCLCAAD